MGVTSVLKRTMELPPTVPLNTDGWDEEDRQDTGRSFNGSYLWLNHLDTHICQVEEEEGAHKERTLHKPLVIRTTCDNHHLEISKRYSLKIKPGIPLKFYPLPQLHLPTQVLSEKFNIFIE